jgi:hypothetical protein
MIEEEKEMERYHELANEMNLSPKQRQMYFQLGAAVASSRASRRGYNNVDAENQAHEDALWALDQVGWKSMKMARCLLTISGM